jgi:hypothetical protein
LAFILSFFAYSDLAVSLVPITWFPHLQDH